MVNVGAGRRWLRMQHGVPEQADGLLDRPDVVNHLDDTYRGPDVDPLHLRLISPASALTSSVNNVSPSHVWYLAGFQPRSRVSCRKTSGLAMA